MSIVCTLRSIVLVTLLACLGAQVHAQQPQASPLQPLAFLVGRWAGTSDGQPGIGRVEREYTWVFGQRYLKVDNQSTYEPQAKNPRGEVHRDTGLFSFDTARKRAVFRQFHSEGFVNQYVSDLAGSNTVFVSEIIENIPPGYRARETYTRIDANTFEEHFELAEPGKAFETYSRSTLRRIDPR